MRDVRKVREQAIVRLTWTQFSALVGLTCVLLVLGVLLGYYLGRSSTLNASAVTSAPDPLISLDVESESVARLLALAEEKGAEQAGPVELEYHSLLPEPAQLPTGPSAVQEAGGDTAGVRSDVTVGDDEVPGGGSAAEEEAKPEPTTAPPPSRTGRFTLQVSSFQTAAQAEELVQELRGRGFDAFRVEATINGRLWHRVRVGHFEARPEAQAEVERLSLARDDLRPMVTTQ